MACVVVLYMLLTLKSDKLSLSEGWKLLKQAVVLWVWFKLWHVQLSFDNSDIWRGAFFFDWHNITDLASTSRENCNSWFLQLQSTWLQVLLRGISNVKSLPRQKDWNNLGGWGGVMCHQDCFICSVKLFLFVYTESSLFMVEIACVAPASPCFKISMFFVYNVLQFCSFYMKFSSKLIFLSQSTDFLLSLSPLPSAAPMLFLRFYVGHGAGMSHAVGDRQVMLLT